MDMAFLRRAEQMLAERHPARMEHQELLAALWAERAARAAQAPPLTPCARTDEDPLIEILLGGPDRRRALVAQRGCFSRAEAGRRVNGS